ncbi:MAG: hypothetical protein KGJ30_15445, partial [Burkholderiales bacterium]|nr:hypothetical protein [Burkholderiales bacterium]
MTEPQIISMPASRAGTPPRAAAQRWPAPAIAELFERPFMDLLHEAQQVHRAHAEARRAGLLRGAGGVAQGVEVHQLAGVDAGVVMHRLRAIAAVLGAT